MVKQRFPFFIYLILFVALLAGCNQRYWYRLKINDGSPKRYTVKVIVINHSPRFLSEEFEDVMKQAGLKELKKHQFIESVKDTPQFFLFINLAIDSFNSVLYNPNRYAPNITFFSDSLNKAPYSYKYNRNIKAILFQCNMVQFKPSRIAWISSDNIYYFNDYRRDLGRSEGVVRSIVKLGCEQK